MRPWSLAQDGVRIEPDICTIISAHGLSSPATATTWNPRPPRLTLMVSSTLQDDLSAVDPLALNLITYISVAQLTVSWGSWDSWPFNLSLMHFYQAYSYDWLLSISAEHRVMSRVGLNCSTTIYLLSRCAFTLSILQCVLTYTAASRRRFICC